MEDKDKLVERHTEAIRAIIAAMGDNDDWMIVIQRKHNDVNSKVRIYDEHMRGKVNLDHVEN